MTAKMLRWVYHREMRPVIMDLAEQERAQGKTILRWRTPDEMRRGLRQLRHQQ